MAFAFHTIESTIRILPVADNFYKTWSSHTIMYITSCLDHITSHYCRMLLTRHYDQRPFDETVCDAIIANDGVKNRQKRCKTFVMEDASNMVQILVACAMQGIRFNSMNCLRWGGTKKGQPDEGVCDVQHTVHLDELFVIRQHKRHGQPDQRCVRYTTCGSLGWTVCVETWEQKWFKWTRCVWYAANRFVIRNVCEDR